MNASKVIEQAKELLKVAKENPEQFKELTKTSEIGLSLSEKAPAANGGQQMRKDDMPHAPNSPEDKAHDVAEGDDSIQHAMKILDTPEKRKAMLEHLRTLESQDQQRSEENREAGEAPQEQSAAPMDKSEVLKIAQGLLAKAKEDPKQFEELTKASAAPAPAAAAMPKPQATKPAAPAMQKPPAMQAKPAMAKCGPMRMSKDEIKADLKSEWKPKYKKEA